VQQGPPAHQVSKKKPLRMKIKQGVEAQLLYVYAAPSRLAGIMSGERHHSWAHSHIGQRRLSAMVPHDPAARLTLCVCVAVAVAVAWQRGDVGGTQRRRPTAPHDPTWRIEKSSFY
jgi:hypothetical protein